MKYTIIFISVYYFYEQVILELCFFRIRNLKEVTYTIAIFKMRRGGSGKGERKRKCDVMWQKLSSDIQLLSLCTILLGGDVNLGLSHMLTVFKPMGK